ncbi:MAG: hypothetical protein JST79_11915 [Acidobacteria bacterium]|nr:hypothetical protein [Acidobacteriota bacterium]
MDFGTVIVVVLTLLAVFFLVFLEKHSRSNDAKLKAQAGEDSGVTQAPPSPKTEVAKRKARNSR